jgi:quercetin dioxygenase-like cupin family protein
MNPRAARTRWDEIALEKLTDMVSRKAVSGDALELVQIYFKKGTLVPLHRHHTERLVYVLQGVVRLIVSGDELILREGEVLVLPAGTERQAECLDDTFLMLVGVRGTGSPEEKPGSPDRG